MKEKRGRSVVYEVTHASDADNFPVVTAMISRVVRYVRSQHDGGILPARSTW
jgi:hypothetical protein